MLSLVVITLNESDRLERCLRSVPFAAEKVVLDSGSTDGTEAVARACGARFVSADWPGHVSQKNRALALATQPWILSLDADEWLEADAADALQQALIAPGDPIGYRFARCSRWRGRPIRHGRWYPDRKLRVIRAGQGRWVGDDPHDQLVTEGLVADLPGDIGHDPYRSTWEHLATVNRYTAIAARSLHGRGVRARRRDLLFRPPLRFVDAYLWRRGLLDGPQGLALAGLGAVYTGMKWGRLWQLQHSESR